MPNLCQPRVLVPSLLRTTLMATSIACCRPSLASDRPASSDHFGDGRFHNLAAITQPGFTDTVGILWRFMTDKPADATPAKPIEVLPVTRADLLAAPGASLWRLGQSTMRERAGLCRGQLSVVSRPGDGTAVELVVPLV